jgi:hypothetical protein
MLETVSINEKLNFQPLSVEEKLRRGILGRLAGPVASFRSPTRNGRRYSEELWEKVFDNDLVNELFNRGGIPGELDHPDRDETCSEKIAIIMPEKPKKNKQGQLQAYFDILDTPCGRIAATLAKYGFQFGISSRGSGDTYTDYDGQESVDPDTYTLNAFDLVLIPACKEAVLNLVEGFEGNKKSLNEALSEALNAATDSERQVMVETLENLNIDYESSTEAKEDEAKEEDLNIDSTDSIAAENSGAEMMKELQEALQQNVELETQIKLLQERLSVCYTKEARYARILERTNADLTTVKTELNSKLADNQKLTENLNRMKSIISEQNIDFKNSSEQSTRSISELKIELNAEKSSSNKLKEALNEKENQLTQLKESLNSQKQEFSDKLTNLASQNAKLKEALEEARKDSQIIKSQANAKITKSQQLVEKYKSAAKLAVDKYIESRATMLGISKTEISKRLNENYSFKDIDDICSDLQRYRLNMKALPFDLESQKTVRMKINESKKLVDPVSNTGVDDEIDEALFSFIHQ